MACLGDKVLLTTRSDGITTSGPYRKSTRRFVAHGFCIPASGLVGSAMVCRGVVINEFDGNIEPYLVSRPPARPEEGLGWEMVIAGE